MTTCRADTPGLTRAQLVQRLRALGLAEGDVVMVYSSGCAFGDVQGGAGTVVGALLDTLGSAGTLVAPTLACCTADGPDRAEGSDGSPARIGAIAERLGTWPGTRGSRAAADPIAALGALAPDLTERASPTAWGFDSAYQRLVELDAWVLLAGVDWNACTLVHLLEERAEVPYRYWADRAGGVPCTATFRCLTLHPGIACDFEPLGTLLERQGLVRSELIGPSLVRAVRARDVYDVGLAALRRDPLTLVSQETRALAQGYLPDYGTLLDDYGRRRQSLWRPEHPVARRLAAVLRVPVAAEVCAETRHHWDTDDGLVLEELRFTGGPNAVVPALLARPGGQTGRRPAVICLHGTGGTWEREMEPRLLERGSTLLGWARELARRGFVTLAITQLNHPPRQEPGDWREPRLLPLYGKTGMGRLVADALLCVDYLGRRADVDPARIAIGGFSLGGIVAFYSMVLDARLAAGFTFCGGVGSVRALVREGRTRAHSAYYYPSGLLAKRVDHPDLVAVLAPRPLLVCGATEDECMPTSGFAAFANAASQAYAAAGASAAFEARLEQGAHRLSRSAFEAAAAFLGRHL